MPVIYKESRFQFYIKNSKRGEISMLFTKYLPENRIREADKKEYKDDQNNDTLL